MRDASPRCAIGHRRPAAVPAAFVIEPWHNAAQPRKPCSSIADQQMPMQSIYSFWCWQRIRSCTLSALVGLLKEDRCAAEGRSGDARSAVGRGR